MSRTIEGMTARLRELIDKHVELPQPTRDVDADEWVLLYRARRKRTGQIQRLRDQIERAKKREQKRIMKKY